MVILSQSFFLAPPPPSLFSPPHQVTFSACHTPIWFSTGPMDNYTHWKQTVFYLENPLTLCEGDTIEGTIAAKPNERNHRDIDVELTYQHSGQVRWRRCCFRFFFWGGGVVMGCRGHLLPATTLAVALAPAPAPAPTKARTSFV